MNKLLITEYETLDDIYDIAYEELLAEGYDQDLPEFEDELHEKVDDIIFDKVEVLYNGNELRNWWADNGWGRMALVDELIEYPNWEELWDYIGNNYLINTSFGEMTMSPFAINDIINDFISLIYDQDEEEVELIDDYPEEDVRQQFSLEYMISDTKDSNNNTYYFLVDSQAEVYTDNNGEIVKFDNWDKAYELAVKLNNK